MNMKNMQIWIVLRNNPCFPVAGRALIVHLSSLQFDGVLPEEEEAVAESPVEKDLGIANIMGEKIEIIATVNSPSLDFNDNEDIPTELSDSSETHDEGTQGRPSVFCSAFLPPSSLCSIIC